MKKAFKLLKWILVLAIVGVLINTLVSPFLNDSIISSFSEGFILPCKIPILTLLLNAVSNLSFSS